MKKNLTKNFFTFLLVFFIIAAFFSLYTDESKKEERISIQQLLQSIEDEKVESILVEGNTIHAVTENGSKYFTLKEPLETFSQLADNYGVDKTKLKNIRIETKEESGFGFWLRSLAPILIPFFLIAVLVWFMLRQIQGANSRAMMFGQSSARQVNKSKNKITFKDVAGAKEAKEELQEIVEFLLNPEKFRKVGATIPRGVLLMGPPGTGKTLLAKAVAGEANVPFFTISGSEFVEMFVGVGASRVRDLFKKAKKNSPCIIFIDEIDAVGRQRGTGLGGSHDEREQTLNQILVEMDGFDTKTNVIVMAATNRPDVLDPALLRPGRFDRRVVLERPDINEREMILKVHSRKKPLDKAVNLRKIAELTPGFSGADLANLINEAAILTARKNQQHITQDNLSISIEKVMLGPERKSHILSEKEKRITAYHEAGHALVAHSLEHSDTVRKVSIISRGRAAGYTIKLPLEDKKMHSKAEFIDELAVLLGGQTAEKVFFKDFTTGASNDLQKATQIAMSLVTRYGMSDVLPPRTFGEHEELIFLGKEIHEQRDYSEKTSQRIDEEIELLINTAAKTAHRIITEKRAVMDRIVEVLMKKETIDGDEFNQMIDGTYRVMDKPAKKKT